MKELSRGSFLPEDFSKKRSVLKRVAIRLVPVSVLIFAGCSGGGVGEKNSSSQELENRESGYSLPFPQGETWFLTNGPHADGWSDGIKYGLDIAPPEVVNCAPGARIALENRTVTASASGQVTIKGNDKNKDDPFHSVVDIKDKNGLTQRFVHLDNTKVKLGDKVKQGAPLGNPSCEYPPGGGNTGPHVHVGLMKDGQAIPIDGVVVGGWTIHNGVNGEDGTMTKPGEKTRTANVGRYGKNSLDIRNDLPNTSNKAVVALPKNPIPPISSTITSKEVFTVAPTPTPTVIPTRRPTETPSPTLAPQRKIPTPTPTSVPTPKPTETPKPVEKSKSVEYQALNASLEHFLSILSTTQEYRKVGRGVDPVRYSITSSVVNDITSFPKNEILEGKQVSPNSDLLKIRWVYTETNEPNYSHNNSRKTLGEAEIKNLKVGLGYTAPVSNADRANGIQWKGQVVISFINRYRVVLPEILSSTGWNPGRYYYDKEWSEVMLPQPTGPFSPWQDSNFGFPPYSDFISNIMLRNGQWEFDQGRNIVYLVYPISIYSLDPQGGCVSWLGNKRIPGCESLPAQPKP